MSRSKPKSDLPFRTRFTEREPVFAMFNPGEPSLTKQADAPGADINNIVKRYLKTGELPFSARAPMFGHMYTEDLKEALDLTAAATESFMALPADVRAAFDNDPVKLLEALDRGNLEELHAAGIFESTEAADAFYAETGREVAPPPPPVRQRSPRKEASRPQEAGEADED